jgi:hypothetical protein
VSCDLRPDHLKPLFDRKLDPQDQRELDRFINQLLRKKDAVSDVMRRPR